MFVNAPGSPGQESDRHPCPYSQPSADCHVINRHVAVRLLYAPRTRLPTTTAPRPNLAAVPVRHNLFLEKPEPNPVFYIRSIKLKSTFICIDASHEMLRTAIRSDRNRACPRNFRVLADQGGCSASSKAARSMSGEQGISSRMPPDAPAFLRWSKPGSPVMPIHGSG